LNEFGVDIHITLIAKITPEVSRIAKRQSVIRKRLGVKCLVDDPSDPQIEINSILVTSYNGLEIAILHCEWSQIALTHRACCDVDYFLTRRRFMQYSYMSDWYGAWGWILWIGFWFLIISSFGNWGYTYRVHRRYGDGSQKTARDILNERYARGDINRDEFHKIKNEIATNNAVNVTQQYKSEPTTNPA
jgi:putative membrane protein